jgi:hypothetical protein
VSTTVIPSVPMKTALLPPPPLHHIQVVPYLLGLDDHRSSRRLLIGGEGHRHGARRDEHSKQHRSFHKERLLKPG